MAMPFSFPRAKAYTLVDSLSELMVDASLGTIQCLEEIVCVLLLHHSCQTLCGKARVNNGNTPNRIGCLCLLLYLQQGI